MPEVVHRTAPTVNDSVDLGNNHGRATSPAVESISNKPTFFFLLRQVWQPLLFGVPTITPINVFTSKLQACVVRATVISGFYAKHAVPRRCGDGNLEGFWASGFRPDT
jgi:hypothetical protein